MSLTANNYAWLKAKPRRKAHRNRKDDTFTASKAWKRRRREYLRADPMRRICCQCGHEPIGKMGDRLIVDHIHARHLGGPSLPADSGLQSLCERCHAIKSATEHH